MGHIVHGFAFYYNPGDYSAPIFPAHSLADFTSYSLCGHMGLNSIKILAKSGLYGAYRRSMADGRPIFTFKSSVTLEKGQAVFPASASILKEKND